MSDFAGLKNRSIWDNFYLSLDTLPLIEKSRQHKNPMASGLDFDVFKVFGPSNSMYAVKRSKVGFKKTYKQLCEFVELLDRVISGPIPYVPPMDLLVERGSKADPDRLYIVMPWIDVFPRSSSEKSNQVMLVEAELEFKNSLAKLGIEMKDSCQFGKIHDELFIFDFSSLKLL